MVEKGTNLVYECKLWGEEEVLLRLCSPGSFALVSKLPVRVFRDNYEPFEGDVERLLDQMEGFYEEDSPLFLTRNRKR